MVTLMALSLCVGLLIDDAIVVRENIVRHVQMGKPAYQAAMDGTQEIGLAVLATTFSIVAVFLPIGFMGGIIGKFFHEFGVTIVAAVLISDVRELHAGPDAVVGVARPRRRGHGKAKANLTFYDRTIGRVTGWFDRATEPCRGLPGHPALVAATSWPPCSARRDLRHQHLHGAAARTEFVPKADYSETSVSFYTPVGSSPS